VAVGPTGADAGDIYVTNNFGADVSVIDPSTNTAVENIAVGNGPDGVAVSPTGADAGDIYVTNTNSDTVSVIEP
jgi:YVTN family beta-propeller protein